MTNWVNTHYITIHCSFRHSSCMSDLWLMWSAACLQKLKQVKLFCCSHLPFFSDPALRPAPPQSQRTSLMKMNGKNVFSLHHLIWSESSLTPLSQQNQLYKQLSNMNPLMKGRQRGDMRGGDAEQFGSAECILTSIVTYTVNETEEDCPWKPQWFSAVEAIVWVTAWSSHSEFRLSHEYLDTINYYQCGSLALCSQWLDLTHCMCVEA